MADENNQVLLLYGRQGLPLNLSGLRASVLRPEYHPGLRDERGGFINAVRAPYGTDSLRSLIHGDESLAIVIPDITRALPTDRLLQWTLDELSHVNRSNVCIIVGTGTHRPNTREELCSMVGADIVESIRIVNHDARDQRTLTKVGRSPYGYDVFFNTEYVRADRRILMGFIEPHFMAGFSGGYKAVFPGIADMNAILQYHGYHTIAHPRSSWGLLENNPTQDHVRAGGSLIPADFLINVTLNDHQEITRYFCGAVIPAHEAGCAYSKKSAMVGVKSRFPIVVTTNSGFPLDLNLYQSVKGMCAADTITAPGGLIITASRCNNGFPNHGPFREQLLRYNSPEEGINAISTPGFAESDQWQSQKLFQILKNCRIQLYSDMNPSDVRSAHLEPVSDIRQAIDAELRRINNPDTPVAVMPEGPLTIPYLESSA